MLLSLLSNQGAAPQARLFTNVSGTYAARLMWARQSGVWGYSTIRLWAKSAGTWK